MTKDELHALSTGTYVALLRTLRKLLEKGAAKARASGDDPETLTEARLAPDMFTLAQQVQMACHYAIESGARLTGAPPPSPVDAPDGTLDGLHDRIARTIAALERIGPATIAAHDVTMPLGPELVLGMDGLRFLRDWSLPHFYFHVVTAYDILRHEGVPLGKVDYLAHTADAIRPRAA